jgi:hypothetical protein
LIRIVSPDHPAEGFEHRFDAQRSIEHRENAVAKCIIESPDALSSTRLGRTDQHHRRRGFDPAEDLQDLLAGRPAVAVGFHREFEVDQGDVDLLLLDQTGRLPAAPRLEAADAEGIEESRQLRRRATLPPGGGEKQVESAASHRIGPG